MYITQRTFIFFNGKCLCRFIVLCSKLFSNELLWSDTVHISGTKLSFTAVSVAVRLRSVSSLRVFHTSFTQLSAFLRDP